MISTIRSLIKAKKGDWTFTEVLTWGLALIALVVFLWLIFRAAPSGEKVADKIWGIFE